MASDRKVVIVTRHTRIEELVARFQTMGQAKFYIESSGASFADYEIEHSNYIGARQAIESALRDHYRLQLMDRRFLPTYLFAPDDVVLALGQDGLVANTLKYLDGQPLIGVNPDPKRHDGLLLPFAPRDVTSVVHDVMKDRHRSRQVTMARASLSDGQSLYAVNDLFIGPRTHTSARYEITLGEASETQSSSGIIVSTGLGSSAWLRSIATGSCAVAASLGGSDCASDYRPLPWDTPYLQFAVREPFPSVASQATLVWGRTQPRSPLRLRSLMPENGVIFSDGMEADSLAFNSGITAVIDVAERAGQLVH